MPSNHGKNEERTAEYFKKFSREKVLSFLLNKKKPVIFDVGSNDGMSLQQFKSIWPDSEVHCFEPQIECWDELEQLSQKTHSVYINKFGVGSTDSDEVEFFTHDLNSGISGFNKINIKSKDSIDLKKFSISKDEIDSYKKTINHSRLVKLRRLDNYIISQGIEHIDLLKLDTQSYELEVLKGMGNCLSNVSLLLTELKFYDYYEQSLSFFDLESLLIPHNFALYDICHIAKNPMNGRTDWVDVLYVNQKLL